MWRLLAWSAHVSSRTNGLLAYQWACRPFSHSMAVAISKKERFICASIALWTNAEGYYFGYSTWNTKPITEHSRNPRGTPGTASSNSQVARPCDFKVPWGRNRLRGKQEELVAKWTSRPMQQDQPQWRTLSTPRLSTCSRRRPVPADQHDSLSMGCSWWMNEWSSQVLVKNCFKAILKWEKCRCDKPLKCLEVPLYWQRYW